VVDKNSNGKYHDKKEEKNNITKLIIKNELKKMYSINQF
jgi:hypothetical protein